MVSDFNRYLFRRFSANVLNSKKVVRRHRRPANGRASSSPNHVTFCHVFDSRLPCSTTRIQSGSVVEIRLVNLWLLYCCGVGRCARTRYSIRKWNIGLIIGFFCVLAAQEGREGLVQTAPKDAKEKRGRIRW